MRKNELRACVDQNPVERGVYSYNELNEVILTIYNILRWCLRDECDTITINDRQVTWSNSDNASNQMATPFNFGATFEQVRKHDEVIRRHMALITQTNDQIIYKLVFTE